jgi:hypothetical protein
MRKTYAVKAYGPNPFPNFASDIKTRNKAQARIDMLRSIGYSEFDLMLEKHGDDGYVIRLIIN